MCRVFEYTRHSGAVLREIWDGQAFSMIYTDSKSSVQLPMYTLSDLFETELVEPYFGLSADAVLASGRDVLTERLLAEGEPSYDRVKPLLPKVEDGAYGFFGGAVSAAGIEIDAQTGNLYSQVIYNNNAPTEPLFSPAEWDAVLG